MLRLALVLVLTAAALPTQVAPVSLATVDGNSGSGAPFDMGIGYRFQQIHRHVPGPVTITAIAFRRDAAAPSTSIPRWWTEFVVRMGEGEFEQALPSLAANRRSPPVEVLQRRRYVLPDWSVPSSATPRPFDFVLPLDVPYVHTGQHPLLWEVEIFDHFGVGALGPIDAFAHPLFTSNQGTPFGTACGVTLTGFAAATPENQFYVWVGESPYAWASVRLFLFGHTDPNLGLPQLCAPLRVDPVAIVDPGPGVNYGIYVPYDPLLAGLQLNAQLVRLTSSGFPLQTSNAVALTLPTMPSHGDQDVLQVTQASPTSLPAIVRGTGVVLMLQ